MQTKISFILTFSIFYACSSSDHRANDREIARVYDKSLYESELSSTITTGINPQDSALLAASFVQRWISDQLLMYEAERNISKDVNLDQLVRDYRASLVRFNFEEQLIAQKLDSTVSDTELRSYYELNKEQFRLQGVIVKCQLLKVPREAPLEDLTKIWKARADDSTIALSNFAQQWAVISLVDPNKWYRLEEIAALLPVGTLNGEEPKGKKEDILSEDGFYYYYRIIDWIGRKEEAPFEFVKEQATQVILHKRKKELLDNWKRNLYDNELRRGNIKVF
jgi:hypothetical protein